MVTRVVSDMDRRALGLDKVVDLTQYVEIKPGDKVFVRVSPHDGTTELRIVSPLDLALQRMRDEAGEPEYWH